ncbi:uncharacterized protein LOC121836561 [Ixodes scapularis]|uniref:uncharacterized protein LOC121836561 n=1 Tax=Ixodes scapularis TaxID=6945 RepID=UPI001C393F8D|nr:uncharacterized protein LOC121836561 [Ixodes scapularis]
MFPLLSDSRFETSMTNYLAESPPETPVPTRHAHTSRAGASGLTHRQRAATTSAVRGRHYDREDGPLTRSVSSGFFKRIFCGTPRKYSFPPQEKDTSPELSFSEVMMRYHRKSPDSRNSFCSTTKKTSPTTKKASERKTLPEVVPAAPPPAQRKKRITPNDRKVRYLILMLSPSFYRICFYLMVYVKILQDALNNQDSSPNSALMVTPDVDTGWFLVSFHVWVRHDHKPLTDAVKRFPKPGATYFVQGGSGTL